jgi:CO/xanthine dehydrogenase FAD-binding subunit
VGGVVAASDGRSALLAVLLALGSRVQTEPGGSEEDLDAFLDARFRDERPRLVIGVRIRRPVTAVYDQVARTPADRPLVCAVIGEWGGASPGRRVVLGGFGPRPVLVREVGDLEKVVGAAVRAYSDAGDEWASAEYRSAMAGVLVRRLAEGMAGG